MKRYIKSNATAFLPYGDASAVAQDAMHYLDMGKRVYIESGALNDVITGYTIEKGNDRGWSRDYDRVLFTTEGGYFGDPVDLSEFDTVDCEYYQKNLFIQVS